MKVDGSKPAGGNEPTRLMCRPAIRTLNRVLCVAQTMVYVLNVLSEVAPEWVRAYVPVEWVERYGERLEHERLPEGEEKRKQYANQVGTDGWTLLHALDAASTADPIENAAGSYDLAHQSSNSNLSQGGKVGNGARSQLCLRLRRSIPRMIFSPSATGRCALAEPPAQGTPAAL